MGEPPSSCLMRFTFIELPSLPTWPSSLGVLGSPARMVEHALNVWLELPGRQTHPQWMNEGVNTNPQTHISEGCVCNPVIHSHQAEKIWPQTTEHLLSLLKCRIRLHFRCCVVYVYNCTHNSTPIISKVIYHVYILVDMNANSDNQMCMNIFVYIASN